ncbi:MAG TPA: DUF1398 family protein [Verrucomicrobiae bacterium]|nr:DUF1398 family protein [Verrucomicrobiae bacterium]
MNTEVMRKTLEASEAGKQTFPEVIRALLGAGVESYHADFVRGIDTFYLPGGETHEEKMKLPAMKIAEDFSREALVTTIRAVQADEIRYPDFLPRAMAAGTTGYWVYLTGEKVIYFGRKGETHVEEFRRAKS